MARFQYRASTASGELSTGVIEGLSRDAVMEALRKRGLLPIEAVPTAARPGASGGRLSGPARQAVINALGELAVLLGAGLPLDRALAIAGENVSHPAVTAGFAEIQGKVKEGMALSQAMALQPRLFSPMASAMAEAGEADGRIGPALARLAESEERREALRQTVVSSLVYPAILVVVAVGVTLLMLLVIVPQFEGLFEGNEAKLPMITQMVVAASRATRAYGLAALGVLAVLGFGLSQWFRAPETKLAFDRWILGTPKIGALVREAQTAAFARTLGSLVEGGVALPTALAISRRSVANSYMAHAIGEVAAQMKQGGGLTGPLTASGVLPSMAISFLRVGEETAQLGPMLGRLADVLDRSTRHNIGRLVTLLTPVITVVMGVVVATVIASIMSAVLGVNDLAIAP